MYLIPCSSYGCGISRKKYCSGMYWRVVGNFQLVPKYGREAGHIHLATRFACARERVFDGRK